MSRLVGGAETWYEQIPHPCVVAKNQEGYLSYGVPTEDPEVPDPHQAPQGSSAGEKSLCNFWL